MEDPEEQRRVTGAEELLSVAEVLAGRSVDLTDLQQQLYGHVLDKIDFDGMYGLEQLLWGLLDERDIEDEDGELAKALIVDAVIRAARDPASYVPVSPPPGITKAEAKAVEFDEACPFCKMEADEAAYAGDPANAAAEAAEAAEQTALYASNARAWRARHAEALKRRGLG
jgi:hypothetical protein